MEECRKDKGELQQMKANTPEREVRERKNKYRALQMRREIIHVD